MTWTSWGSFGIGFNTGLPGNDSKFSSESIKKHINTKSYTDTYSSRYKKEQKARTIRILAELAGFSAATVYAIKHPDKLKTIFTTIRKIIKK